MNSGERGFPTHLQTEEEEVDRGPRSLLSPAPRAQHQNSEAEKKTKQEQCSVTSLVTHIPHGKRLVSVPRRAESRKSSSEKIASTRAHATEKRKRNETKRECLNTGLSKYYSLQNCFYEQLPILHTHTLTYTCGNKCL